MIITRNSKETQCESFFTGGDLEAITNLSSNFISETGGCRAYALLEASLGYCLTVTVRKYAQTNNIALEDVTVTVKLDLSDRDNPIIERNIELIGNLSDLERQKLMKSSEACSIYKSLLNGVTFK